MPGLVGGPFPVPPRLRRHGKAAHTPTDHHRGRLCPQVGRVKTNKGNINTHKKKQKRTVRKSQMDRLVVNLSPPFYFSSTHLRLRKQQTFHQNSLPTSTFHKRKDELRIVSILYQRSNSHSPSQNYPNLLYFPLLLRSGNVLGTCHTSEHVF